jgi:hypothetical protein
VLLARIADLRHRDALVCADGRVTHAAVSICVTAAAVLTPVVTGCISSGSPRTTAKGRLL